MLILYTFRPPNFRGKVKGAETNVNKSRKGRRLNLWSEDAMANAIREVNEKKLKLRVASRAYNVPLVTLQRRVKKALKKGNIGHCSGRAKAFSAEQEECLANHCRKLATLGFPLTLDKLRQLSCSYAESCGVNLKTHNNKTSYIWLHDFMRRNNRATRKSENLTRARAACLNRTVVNS